MCALHTEFCVYGQHWNWASLRTDGHVQTLCGFCPCLCCVPVCLDLWVESLTGCCASASWAAGPFLVWFLAESFSKTLRGCWHSCELASVWIEGWCTRKEREENLVFYETPGCVRCFILLSIRLLWVWDGRLGKQKMLNLVEENRVRAITYW